jgi:hypothetical protein
MCVCVCVCVSGESEKITKFSTIAPSDPDMSPVNPKYETSSTTLLFVQNVTAETLNYF